jgi:UDP-N-acetylglucosamine--N-acetylmuramyl-(pentapeptide) pyrophosphoryl-undecaprenol N-acetylglucosamine transferase
VKVEKMLANRKIIISGGGTGGHVFPAIAIADALRNQLDNPEILFVGAKGRMEMEKVPEAGYSIIGLPVEGFRRKFSLANLKVILNLFRSLRMARKIIRKFSPDVVVGVGGYASGPVLRKAASMGIPTLIQEQNSYAGVTNRLLAKKAKKICVAYEGMGNYFPAEKLVLAGNPVRKEILQIRTGDNTSSLGLSASPGPAGTDAAGTNAAGTHQEVSAGMPTGTENARVFFGIREDARVLLILGGSLGARTINLSVQGKLDLILESGVTVLWQCGKYYYEEVKKSLEGAGESIILKDFIQRMDMAYMAADVIIARAGAITISELCLVGKPSILVPSPNVAEDHQTKNAKALSSQSAAIYIPDKEAPERMIPEALELLGDKGKQGMLSKNISGMAIEDSAGRIAKEVIGIM